MNKILFLISVFVFLVSAAVKQDATMPSPELTLTEAVNLSVQRLKIDFNSSKLYLNNLQVDNFIAVSAKYEKQSAAEKKQLLQEKKSTGGQMKEWYWYIVLALPADNSQQFVYKISAIDDIKLIRQPK